MRQFSIFTEKECKTVTTGAIEGRAIKLVTFKFSLKVYFSGVLCTFNFAIFKRIVKETCTISHSL